jgi:PQQ-dependent dehydrogenase (s-GDH family)
MALRTLAAALLLVVGTGVVVSSRQNPRTLGIAGPETFASRVVATGLANPWEVTWGPDDRLWITERTGYRVTRLNPADGSRRVAVTLEDVYQSASVQDGLMGLALHPDLLKGRGRDYVYVAYTYDGDPGPGATRRLRVRRFTYDGASQTLAAPMTVIDNLPAHDDHGGGRLIIGPDGKLYLSRGDQGSNFLANFCNPIRSQDLPTASAVAARDWTSYQGKILRMELDGAIPADNPTIDGVRSHIFAYGLRNPQGLSFGPTGRLYASEHGPSTDDEVDLIQAGKNYGWPHVAGFNDDRGYVYANWSQSSPQPCRSLTFNNLNPPASVPIARESSWSHADFVPPLATLFTPPAGYDLAKEGNTTIGPGHLEVYDSPAIPGWRQSLLVTGMRTGVVYRLKVSDDGASIVGPPLEYFAQPVRYRDTAVAPDGRRIYVSTDNFGNALGPKGSRAEALLHPGAILEFTYSAPASRN